MPRDRRFKIIESDNYDGDSFNLTLDLGFNLITHQQCRLFGIDTPELRGGTARSKAAAALARDMARGWVAEAMGYGGAEFASENYTGKYGRPLGDIVRVRDGASLRETLIGERLGVRYNGQAKSEVQDEHEANIEWLEREALI